ncbi:MAG: NnrS family protein [Burkholderiales bacterium]|nr:NnrS family protein [Burkholderiales bacterium]MCE7877687.1 NnrS family protein [Betaproteobacteria bacterium PRO3]
MPPTTPTTAALWASPFRPFCVFGAGYGVVLMAAWTAVQASAGPAHASSAWHGHEMLYGFAGAIACGITLTALPGWAGTREIRGTPLALLVALWLAGRVAFWSRDLLPPALALALAAAPWAAMSGLLVVQLAPHPDRRYLMAIVVFAAFAAGEAMFVLGEPGIGLRAAVHALVLLYALACGVFTPVFTGNHLRAKGRGDQARAWPALDTAAIGSIVAVAAVDLAGAAPPWRVAVALAAFALNAVRLVRWQGWKTFDAPLLWTMHAGYAWMTVAFLLLALGSAGIAPAERAWLHAFTVGALGSAMIGIMTRVALRHTGRPLDLSGRVVAAHVLVQVAAFARVTGALAVDGAILVVAAGLAWATAFALYLATFGAILLRPSLPRIVAAPLSAREPPAPR